jgi:hypothetical protein
MLTCDEDCDNFDDEQDEQEIETTDGEMLAAAMEYLDITSDYETRHRRMAA